MIQHVIQKAFLSVAVALLAATAVTAQGIELKSSAKIYFGTASTCTQPATIDVEKVRDATPEWKTIRSEGVRKGTARYSLLMSEMASRIERACRKVAEDDGRDCVVGEGGIKQDNGLEVKDITSAVVEMLESGDVSP